MALASTKSPTLSAPRTSSWADFVQDNYRVTPKLTLNLGDTLRRIPSRTERFNRQNSLDLTQTNPINGGSISYTDPLTGQAVTRALLGVEVFATSKDRANFGTDWKDIQPRFGFAYQCRIALYFAADTASSIPLRARSGRDGPSQYV